MSEPVMTCPACHHEDHQPGQCPLCPYCELHTDDAFAWVQRVEPSLLRAGLMAGTQSLIIAVNRYRPPGFTVDEWREILTISATIGPVGPSEREQEGSR